MKEFDKERWLYLGQWAQPTVSEATWDHWMRGRPSLVKLPNLSGDFLSFYGHSFVTTQDYALLKEFILGCNGNFELLKQMEDWVHAVHNEAQSFSVDSKAPIETLTHFRDVYGRVVTPWTFLLLAGDIVNEEIEQLCKKNKYGFAAIASAVEPLHKSFMVRQVEEAAQLHKKLGGAKSLDGVPEQLASKIEEHVARFAFCGVHHFVGEPYTLEKFFSYVPKETEKKHLEVSIPDDLKWYVAFMSLSAWARTHMAETSDYLQHKIIPLLKASVKELGIAEADYMWLSLEEYITGLENSAAFSAPVNLAARKKQSGVYSIDGKEIIIGGEEVQHYINAMVPCEDVVFPLKGMVASQGNVEGTVRIVISPEDIHKVNEGDILVAQETTPDFIMGMKKAAAIVTARGGITSHAAIVSREIGVPCIVGVKGVTQALTDGEGIIVDAEKGLIRKLDDKKEEK